MSEYLEGLKKGDRVIIQIIASDYVGEVVRTTPTKIVVKIPEKLGEPAYRRSDGREIGKDATFAGAIVNWDQKRWDKLIANGIAAKLNRFNFERLSLDQLQRIEKILEEK